MKTLAAVALGCLVLTGCNKLRTLGQDIRVSKTDYAPGETIVVQYVRAIDPAPGEQYWLTLAPDGSPESEWGTWHYVANGAVTDLLVASTPGDYEVRLHDAYPRVPQHLVSRVKIHVK